MRALIYSDISGTPSGDFPSDAELREAFRFKGLREHDYPEMAQNEDGKVYEKRLTDYFQEKALKILARIPDYNNEQKAKKEQERIALIFTGYLPKTETDFMVTRRSDSSILFRLLNSRIGKLQEGSADIVLSLQDFNKQQSHKTSSKTQLSNIRFELHPEIELYEHDLEEPTVNGTIITNRLTYTLREESRETVLALVTLSIFLLMLIVSREISQPAHPDFYAAWGRIETAFITTTFISVLSLIHYYYRLIPIIQWSIAFKQKKT